MSICSRKLFVIVLLFCSIAFTTAALAAQMTAEPLPVAAFDALTLRQLTRSSGYIFVGTVTRIQAGASAPNKLATMRITFHVDQAIRGVRSGQSLTTREWAGLWESGGSYRIGQRLLLFLYPPSKLGLTSAVGGWQGRFALDSQGEFILGQERLIANPIVRRSWNGNKFRVGIREFRHAIRRAEEEE
jgi:hypothetical protein